MTVWDFWRISISWLWSDLSLVGPSYTSDCLISPPLLNSRKHYIVPQQRLTDQYIRQILNAQRRQNTSTSPDRYWPLTQWDVISRVRNRSKLQLLTKNNILKDIHGFLAISHPSPSAMSKRVIHVTKFPTSLRAHSNYKRFDQIRDNRQVVNDYDSDDDAHAVKKRCR